MFKINFPFIGSRAYLTLDEFLTNPSGKKASYMSARKNIIADLELRYNNLLYEYKKFDFTVYKEGTTYVYVFKIPSETYENLYYDVVLEFIEDSETATKSRVINNHSMNFFSNSPNMMFTYTYVLNKNKILVDWLKKYKCAKLALTKRPKVTNPVEQFGFEKSCYYAAMYIKKNRLNIKTQIDQNALPVNRRTKLNMLNSIKSQDKKLDEYNKKKKENKNKK